MSAGSSPTGGIGGLFYAILLFTGMIMKKDEKRLRSNARMLVPIILAMTFFLVAVINTLAVGRYLHLHF